MKRPIYAVLWALLLSLHGSSALADVRVALVDLGRVLNETQIAKTAKEKLDTLASAAQKKIKQRQDELRALEEEAGLKNKGEPLDDMASTLQIKKRDFARYVKDNQEELRAEFARVNTRLTTAALKKVQEYGKKNGYDLVFGKSTQERGTVLFGDTRVDITDAIIKQLNVD